MDERKLFATAALLRRVGAGRLLVASRGRPPLRIVLTHHVERRLLDNFGRLVEAMIAGRRVLSPEEVLKLYAGGSAAPPDPQPALAFTFDDGLLSSYEAAQRVLVPLGIRAMFFVPTRLLELRSRDEMREFFATRVYRRASRTMPEEWYASMTLDHLAELSEHGHMVLPHTHSHRSLAQIVSAADIEKEIVRPRALLEDLLQRPAPVFAFPFGGEGDVGPAAYEQVRRHFAVSMTGLNGVNGPRTPPHSLFRDCVHPHFTTRQVEDVLAGGLDVPYAWKMSRLRRRTAA